MVKIIIVGDVHGDFAALNQMINKKRPDIVLACGDFGYWPKFASSGTPKPGSGKIYFCDGNHEDHWSLRDLANREVWPNTFYMPRGSHLVLPDGRRVMFIGGAASVDREWRTEGVDWFKEELITEQQAFDLPDVPVDIVVSHTCPSQWVDSVHSGGVEVRDPSTMALSHALNKYQPRQWYFGHWHCYKAGRQELFDGPPCDWVALSHTRGEGRWWVEEKQEKQK